MGVFDMTKVMIPVCIAQVLFWATIGYSILKWALKPEDPNFNEGNFFAENDQISTNQVAEAPTWQQNLSLIVMLGCILGFALCGIAPFNKCLDIAVVPMLGATVLLVTGCMPADKTYKSLPWTS